MSDLPLITGTSVPRPPPSASADNDLPIISGAPIQPASASTPTLTPAPQAVTGPSLSDLVVPSSPPQPDVALRQLQQPQPLSFGDPSIAPMPTPADPYGTGAGPAASVVPDTGEGLLSGILTGYGRGMGNLQRAVTGQAFTPDTAAQPEPQERSFWNQVGYGVGGSVPTVAGGILGGAAGTAAGTAVGGPVGGIGGGIIGTGLGMGIPTFAQELAPSYQSAIQNGMTHDQAVTYALEKAAATGGITAATAPFFQASALAKGVLGKFLINSLVAMPASGAATRVGVPLVMGEPLPTLGQLATGAAQDVITGAAFGAGHAAASHAVEAARPPVPEPATSLAFNIAREQLAPSVADLGQAPPRIEPNLPMTARGTATGELVRPGEYQQQVQLAGETPPGITPEAQAPPVPEGGYAERPAARLPGGPEAQPTPGSDIPGIPGLSVEPAEGLRLPSPTLPVPGAETPVVAPEPRPTTGPEAAAVPRSSAEPSERGVLAEPRITTEPDHLDPNRSVAKNEAGEVIGKGATPEEATADAQQRNGQPYPVEEPAAQPEPRITEPTAPAVPEPRPAEPVSTAAAEPRIAEPTAPAVPEPRPAEPASTAAVEPRPAEPITTARPPEAYLKLDPNIPAEDYAQRMAELRDNKPRPINKLWKNPEIAPPDQVEAARAALRDWNREYRIVSKNQKLAQERDNEAFRTRQQEAQTTGEAQPPVAAEERSITVEEPAALTRPEDQALVPGTTEERGTTGPQVRETPRETSYPTKSTELTELTEPRYPANPSKQLERLTATRDMLEIKRARTQAEERKLAEVRGQVERLAAREVAAEDRGGRGKKPFTGLARPKLQPGFIDYKFNTGVSVYRSVFEQAGYNPDLATSRTIEWQNDVLTQHMRNTFGFTEVSLAKDATPVDQYQIRNAMLDMTRAMQDWAATQGQPRDAVSLNGRIKLVFDPEGKRGYYGRYQLSTGEIRITGRANSFGHEWTHALDHLLAERATNNPGLTNDLLTRYARRDQLDPKDGVQGAFARVLNTLFYDKSAQALREMDLLARAQKKDAQGNPTKDAQQAQEALAALERGNLRLRITSSEFRRSAAQMPQNRAYFMDPVELLARAHEAYQARNMKNAGVDPRGIAMPDEAYNNESERLLKLLYPKGEEQANIFKAFDDLHNELRKANVLSQGRPAEGFPNFGIADPRYYPPVLARQPVIQSTRREATKWAARTRAILASSLFDPSRPHSPLTKGQEIADYARAGTYSDGGLMQVIIDRVPTPAKRYLQHIRDLLTTDPGSGRYTPEFLQERSRDLENSWMRRYTRILQNNGYTHPTKMPAEINAMIHHGMTTGENTYPPDLAEPNVRKPIPDHVQKIIGQLRAISDEVFETSKATQLDIGYADSHFPRAFDKRRITDNPDGFQHVMTQVYGVDFDKTHGAPGSDPQHLLETWTTMSKEYKAGASPELRTAMTKLAKNLREQRRIEENPAPTTPAEQARLQQRLQQLKGEAEQLAKDNHAELRDHLSAKQADALYSRMTNPALKGFENEGLNARHMSARSLPPETDVIARDYMIHDIHDALPHYYEQMARRIADAERFGPSGTETLRELYEAARRAGAHPDDLDSFDESVQRVRGVDQPREPSKLVKTSKYLHAYGSVVLMTRAAWSSLAEPINSGIVTGSVTMGPRMIAQQFADGFGKLFRTASARDRAELAEFLDLIHSAQADTIMNSRMGADYSDTPQVAKFMGGFYRLTGLTQLTNSQRAALTVGNHWFLTKLAKSYQNQADGFGARFARDKAERWFNEMGVPEELHGDFAKWLTDLGGTRPTVDRLLADNMAPIYGLAMRRLANRIIQNPFKVDRAAWADKPLIGLAYQLMSFNYAYVKNVLEPAFLHNITHAYKFAKEDALAAGASGPAAQARAVAFATPRALGAAGGVATKMAAAAGALIGATFLVTAVREAFFSPDKWKEHEDAGTLGDWLWDLSMQRSGLNGTLDPIIQVLTNLKYITDLQSLFDGGGFSWLTRNANDVLQGAYHLGSGDTNASLFRATRGAFNLVGLPLVTYGLNTVGGINPVMRAIAGAALQYGTSSENVTHMTEAATGFKGVKPADANEGKLQDLEGLQGLQGLQELGAAPKETAGEGAGLGGGNVPWAVMDDFAGYAAKILPPVWRAIPGPVKAVAAVGAAAGTAASVWQAGEKYRGQPRPEKPAR